MEADLGTHLEWVAVDHWDTANPHTHVVLRGVDDVGRDLVIDREYLSHGMRRRACELASEWLGPRTEMELRQALQRDVKQERWTNLDRQLSDLRARRLAGVATATDRRRRNAPAGTADGSPSVLGPDGFGHAR